MTILITGFGAFGANTQNPSGQVARALDGETVAGHPVVAAELPVATHRVGPELDELIARHRPALVLNLGLAHGRERVGVERVAINLRDFPIPDTDGAAPSEQSVAVDGPDAYLTTLPVRAIRDAWAAAGLPGEISHTAGTYVCNQTMYEAAHRTRGTGLATGFIHVPATPESAAETAANAAVAGEKPRTVATVPFDEQIRAVRIAAEVCLGGHEPAPAPAPSGALD